MKLLNKKTEEIKTTEKVGLLGRNGKNVWSTGEYSSLAELNEEWEDVGSTNDTNTPLIKDEKIKKALGQVVEMEASINQLTREFEAFNKQFKELCGSEE